LIREAPLRGDDRNKEDAAMKTTTTVRKGTKLGAAIGGILFLAFGVIPGFYFGSYAALMLVNHLTGGAMQATVLLRVVTAAGIMLGITCMGFMSIVVGAIVGTAAGYAVQAISHGLEAKTPAESAQVRAE
jgi:hypothetical protein